MCISVIKYTVVVPNIVVVVALVVVVAGVCIIILAYFPAVPAICIRCRGAYS